MGKGWSAGTAGMVAVLTLAFALPASARAPAESATSEPGEQPPSSTPGTAAGPPSWLDEMAALAGARAAVASQMGASAAAEADRRQAEEALVAAHLDTLAAEADFAQVEDMLDVALVELERARERQQAAQEQFDRGVATSYKFGGAVSSALLLTALQSASDAHELARAVNALDSVLGHAYEDLGAATRATQAAGSRVDRLTRLRGVAYIALQHAQAAIPSLREQVQQARAAAWANEQALLDTTSLALDAEQAVVDAKQAAIAAAPAVPDASQAPLDARPVPAGDPAPPVSAYTGGPLSVGTATVDPLTGPTIEQRREWLADRRGVLAEESSLPAEAWTVRPGVTCPVAGATFSNDFHFPRSHGRRHLGTDVFAERGTPIVAVAAGHVTEVDQADSFDGDNDLGGITVSYTTEFGHLFNAHMLQTAPGLEAGDLVEAGQVIGYVGNSGNAAGGPTHLHLGWYVDDVAVNPWPTLAVVCHPDTTA